MDQPIGTYRCPDCGQPLEVMKACGATSYFCNHCNELKSSQRVREHNAAGNQEQH
ncbi:YfgJ family double zinc ribbon protein [Chitiniphilus shinanonensis]|uniref:YfgJ family double zinc ribbon protein n=1 Tax=Chitiniphilus shinanonensis TaxID=553088 RepID=UPI00306D7EFB